MQWIFKEFDSDQLLIFSRTLGLDPLYAKLLLTRNIITQQQLEEYFNPTPDKLYDPFLMKDMKKALLRIRQALAKEEKILVYGDYDVDGITSASILYLFFQKLGGDICYYIPDREKEGYGLSREGLDHAVRLGVSLIITCDCGINAVEKVRYAKQKGLDVIITDHHEPSPELPPALAIVNPKQTDDIYPEKNLCGAGVAFKLIQGYCRYESLDEETAYDYLDLVALGTAADIVSMTGENRILMSEGLRKINVGRNRIGLKALMDVSRIRPEEMDVSKIVFGIAPRLNAVGRLGEASRAVKLLTTQDPVEAKAYSEILDDENTQRRAIEKDVMEEAIQDIEKRYPHQLPNILVLHNPTWHPGVIGIVASKIKELYHRPVIMIAFQDELGKGSGRSITGFDLYGALHVHEKWLQTYGGHVMAAGLTISRKNLDQFMQDLHKFAEDTISPDLLEPRIYIDAEVEIEQINMELLTFLDRLRPFGPGNMRPKFYLKNVQPQQARIVGGNHLKFRVRKNHRSLDCIAWNFGEELPLVSAPGKTVDLVFVPSINDWNGTRSIQLIVKDLKPHEQA
ncbi:single-stranded-DNA-specific exonuclease RecJ [Fidelibacter multiformis]|jgi:single-stranded-DNA-specific exonuclease|uniref:single-stranded-DNA-specific exonuclease RecJ n=1 Tax=Fidelibacter multiformis TaxID=3377529 RepID=UPI0037DC2992